MYLEVFGKATHTGMTVPAEADEPALPGHLATAGDPRTTRCRTP